MNELKKITNLVEEELIKFEINNEIDARYSNFNEDTDIQINDLIKIKKDKNFNEIVNSIKEKFRNSNFIENNTSYSIDEQNFLTFKTRRNRRLNLTEYYDLVYEYRNDCLTAGIKYNKTYYQDRALKPSENLFFTISLIPLTSYEQKIDR